MKVPIVFLPNFSGFFSSIDFIKFELSSKYCKVVFPLVEAPLPQTIFPFLFSEPRVDDIVLFKNSDKIMVKRISKILNGKYYVRGDNKVDSKNIEPISKREILGKVVITL